MSELVRNKQTLYTKKGEVWVGWDGCGKAGGLVGGFGAQRKRETEVVCLWCISNTISVLEEVGLQRFSKFLLSCWIRFIQFVGYCR